VRHDKTKSREASVSAGQVRPTRSEPQQRRILYGAEVDRWRAELEPQTRTLLARGEHEPGCARKHSPRQRCAP
jgi:hypothetical protein